jgi:excisionase family DNA binding protein
MKPTLLSVKELAQELGISTDSVYRAYRKKEIPAEQINRMIRFNLEKVHRAMEKKANAMPNSQRSQQGATAGQGRRRAQQKSPRSVKRGRKFQGSSRRVS